MDQSSTVISIIGRGHSQCISESILECWGKEGYSNVMFICKKEEHTTSRRIVSANKAVLAASSSKLARLLADAGEADDVTTIMVPDTNFSTMDNLLKYIYSGEIRTNQLTDELKNIISELGIPSPNLVKITKATATSGKLPDGTEDSNLPPPVEDFEGSKNGPEKQTKTASQLKRGTSDEITSGYAFLDPFLRKSAGQAKTNRGSSVAKTPKKRSTAVQDTPTKEAIAPPTSTGTENDSVPKDESSPPKRKKKKMDKTSNEAETLGGKEEDVAVESDNDEDRQDSFFAHTYLNEEKSRYQTLNSSATDLKESIERLKLYLKHFFGVETLEATPSGQTKVIRIPCASCGKTVLPDSLLSHLALHIEERPYLCDQCGKSFALEDQLARHARTHLDESQLKTYTCSVCDQTFKRPEPYKRHLTLHTGEKRFSCPYCDKVFRLYSGCRKHIRIHTGERPYECEICHKRFTARSTYVTHVRSHKNGPSLRAGGHGPVADLRQCDICGASFRREDSYLIHLAGHKGEEPQLPCRFCPETFAAYKLLKGHLRAHHPDQMFHCDQCPSMFLAKENLHIHMQAHKRGQTFPCEICQKEFKAKTTLKAHVENVHSEERPFRCLFENCDKTFKSLPSLRLHTRTHSEVRPYKCTYCPKAFHFNPHLMNHLRTHSGERPFSCQHCDKAFSTKHGLKEHIRTHTGEKHQCSACGQVFRSAVRLREHESSHTPTSDPEEREDE